MLTTYVIDNIDEFKSIRPEWTELLAASSSNSLFLTWEWMYTWWLHLAEDRRLYIVVAKEGSTVIGIAPLALCAPRYSRMMPFPHLEFIASGSIGSDYLSFILRDSDSIAAMAAINENIAQRGYMVELTRVEETTLLANSLPSLVHSMGGTFRAAKTNICPYIDIQGKTWKDYLDGLSNTHQKYFTRKLRKLRKDFSVEFSTVTTEDERELAMSEFLALHIAHWKNRRAVTAFEDQRIVSFHRDFSKIAFDSGWLRLFRLQLDGDTAAAVYQFRYNNNYYYFQSALNDMYTKYSAGMITLGLAIQQAIGEGASVFDLLHDNEEYKYLWTDKERYLVRFEVYPPSIHGVISRSVLTLKSLIRPTSLAYRRLA